MAYRFVVMVSSWKIVPNLIVPFISFAIRLSTNKEVMNNWMDNTMHVSYVTSI